MTRLIFDHDEMRMVAKAVLAFNEYAKGDTIENIVDHMTSLAHGELAKLYRESGRFGYCSTYGYVLTSFAHPAGLPPCGDGAIGIKASVAASLFRDLTHVEDER